MGIFNRHKAPHIIHDDVFGELLQRTDGAGNCFEGEGAFYMGAGQPRNVALLVYADKEGPTQAQRDFYSRMQGTFEQYISKMIPLIEKELKLWGKDITIRDFNKEFSLAVVILSRANELPLSWEAILNTIHDTNHQIIVDFRGDEPVDILIDV